MFYVYAIKSLTKARIYIGHTNDLEVRLKYHNFGYVKSTANDRPWRLAAIEKVENRQDARWIERALKKSKGKRLKWLYKYRIEA
jgi:putative endonuclease